MQTYLVVILAVLASRVWTTLVGPLEFGMYVLYPGHIGLWLIFLLGPVLMMRGARGIPPTNGLVIAFCAGLGWAADQSVYLILREDPGQSYWGWPAVTGTCILTIVVLVAFWLLARRRRPALAEKPAHGDIAGRLALCWRLFLWSMVVLLAVFRLADVGAQLSGITYTNDEVSLFILGYEIHHIWWGTLAMMAAGLIFLWPLPTRRGLRNASLLMSLGLGATADELLYYMEHTMTLESYLALPSLLGALAAGIAALLIGWFTMRTLRRSLLT